MDRANSYSRSRQSQNRSRDGSIERMRRRGHNVSPLRSDRRDRDKRLRPDDRDYHSGNHNSYSRSSNYRYRNSPDDRLEYRDYHSGNHNSYSRSSNYKYRNSPDDKYRNSLHNVSPSRTDGHKRLGPDDRSRDGSIERMRRPGHNVSPSRSDLRDWDKRLRPDDRDYQSGNHNSCSRSSNYKYHNSPDDRYPSNSRDDRLQYRDFDSNHSSYSRSSNYKYRNSPDDMYPSNSPDDRLEYRDYHSGDHNSYSRSSNYKYRNSPDDKYRNSLHNVSPSRTDGHKRLGPDDRSRDGSIERMRRPGHNVSPSRSDLRDWDKRLRPDDRDYQSGNHNSCSRSSNYKYHNSPDDRYPSNSRDDRLQYRDFDSNHSSYSRSSNYKYRNSPDDMYPSNSPDDRLEYRDYHSGNHNSYSRSSNYKYRNSPDDKYRNSLHNVSPSRTDGHKRLGPDDRSRDGSIERMRRPGHNVSPSRSDLRDWDKRLRPDDRDYQSGNHNSCSRSSNYKYHNSPDDRYPSNSRDDRLQYRDFDSNHSSYSRSSNYKYRNSPDDMYPSNSPDDRLEYRDYHSGNHNSYSRSSNYKYRNSPDDKYRNSLHNVSSGLMIETTTPTITVIADHPVTTTPNTTGIAGHPISTTPRTTGTADHPDDRPPRPIPDIHSPRDPKMDEDEQYTQAIINLKKLDFFWDHYNDDWLRDLYHPFRATCLQPRNEMLQDAAYNHLDLSFVHKLPSEKHGWLYICKAQGCQRVFQARVFVHKHLDRKHPELVGEAVEKASDGVFLHNYMMDLNAPYDQQKSDLDPAPAVLVPIPRAGPLGPSVTAPKEIAVEVMAQSELNNPRIYPETQALEMMEQSNLNDQEINPKPQALEVMAQSKLEDPRINPESQPPASYIDIVDDGDDNEEVIVVEDCLPEGC